MGRVGHAVLGALLAAVCAVSGCGSSESLDERSGRAFVAALQSVEESRSRDAKAGEAVVVRLLARVRASCPGVLFHAPLDGGELRREAFDAIEIARRQGNRPASKRFTRIVSALRFSEPEISREVQEAVRADSLRTAMALPDICADARAFMRSHGKLTPPGTRRLFAEEHVFEEAEPLAPVPLSSPAITPADTLLAILQRYESPAERRRRAVRERENLDGAPAREFVRNGERLLRELGLPSS
jgi:hypothetical protein